MLTGFLKLSNLHEKEYKKTIPLALQISYDMTLGALKEISSKKSVFDISKVKEIINLETSSIIRNAMIIGFTAGEGEDKEIINLLDDIGYCCGYIFQALNDLEPFGNAHSLILHKGALTTDFLKNRKNIVIAYIYAWASESELVKISNLNNSEFESKYVISLIDKYHIKEHILEEVSNLQLRIQNRIVKIEKKTGHYNWCHHFNNFINITIAASKKRALC